MKRNYEQNWDTTVISIDWDFFIWNSREAKKPLGIVNRNGHEIKSDILSGWGKDVRLSDETIAMLWRDQKRDWDRFGLDLEEEINIRPDRGCTVPDEFVSVIHRKTLVGEGETFVHQFDSHALAYFLVKYCFEEYGEPVHLIHFDAHHDLGYTPYANIQEQIEKDLIECGSWLFHAIRVGYVGSVEIVYPDWRGTKEWKESIKSEGHIEQIKDKIKVYAWKVWKKRRILYTDVRCVGIAKSAAWTPPWLDREYMEFVSNLNSHNHIVGDVCLDCAAPDLSLGGDACKVREWNSEG